MSTQIIFKRYYELNKDGDKTKITEINEHDKNQIMKNHYGSAVKMALRYYNTFQYYRNQNQYSSPLAFDDFLQEALKGIVIAIDKYDYGHASQATFNTYAHQWIR